MIADALSYPIKGSGILIMILGTVGAVALQFAAIIPFFGLAALALFYGYFIAYYYHIAQKTATGSDADPDWPDVSDFLDDLISPTLQVLGVLIVSNLLWALAIWQTGPDSVISMVGRVFGIFYFPMALLAVIILGNLAAANPMRILPSILRTLPSYALVGAVLVGLSFLIDLIDEALESSPFLSLGVITLLLLYFITVHARLLGLFYRKEAEKLDWL